MARRWGEVAREEKIKGETRTPNGTGDVTGQRGRKAPEDRVRRVPPRGGGGRRRGQTDFAIVYFSGNYIFP